MLLATVNWESVAVIVGSVIGAGAIVIKWITQVLDRNEQRRAEETREIVLEALRTHMDKEERDRKKARRKTRAWQKEIVAQLAEVREQVMTGQP